MQTPLDILFEDNHLLVVNKPAGLLVQGDRTGDETLLDQAKFYIKRKYDKPGDVFLHAVHRLDRPVSGVVILARTSKALERMNKQFQRKQVEKTYVAVVDKMPKEFEGTLTHWLKKDVKTNTSKAYNTDKHGGKESTLDYHLLRHINHDALLEIHPKTGRPHQIRVQLAKMGCPIQGDKKYGSKYDAWHGMIHLHAKEVSFVHPVKNTKVEIQAPLPHSPIWQKFK